MAKIHKLISFSFNSFIPLIVIPILLFGLLGKQNPKQTNLVCYIHENFLGPETSAITVAGEHGTSSNILKFGTIAATDDLVTDGPDPNSKRLGRAQGLYVNSQLDGKAMNVAFSVIFTEGEYRISTLEIQGADLFAMGERELSVVSGTGELLDVPNLKCILKLNMTVKHY